MQYPYRLFRIELRTRSPLSELVNQLEDRVRRN